MSLEKLEKLRALVTMQVKLKFLLAPPVEFSFKLGMFPAYLVKNSRSASTREAGDLDLHMSKASYST